MLRSGVVGEIGLQLHELPFPARTDSSFTVEHEMERWLNQTKQPIRSPPWNDFLQFISLKVLRSFRSVHCPHFGWKCRGGDRHLAFLRWVFQKVPANVQKVLIFKMKSNSKRSLAKIVLTDEHSHPVVSYNYDRVSQKATLEGEFATLAADREAADQAVHVATQPSYEAQIYTALWVDGRAVEDSIFLQRFQDASSRWPA
jgi:hypothetical protein